MSTLKADTIQSTGGGAATLTKQSAAKGWVKYNQVLNLADGSYNVSSVTDISTGKFAQNHISAMSDANYSTTFTTGASRVLGTNQEDSSGGSQPDSASVAYFNSLYNSSAATYTNIDMQSNGTVIHGDLA